MKSQQVYPEAVYSYALAGRRRWRSSTSLRAIVKASRDLEGVTSRSIVFSTFHPPSRFLSYSRRSSFFTLIYPPTSPLSFLPLPYTMEPPGWLVPYFLYSHYVYFAIILFPHNNPVTNSTTTFFSMLTCCCLYSPLASTINLYLIIYIFLFLVQFPITTYFI